MLFFRAQITEISQVGEARRITKRYLEESGFTGIETEKPCIIVNEAASNLVKHTAGKGGELLLQLTKLPSGMALDIWALDKGPGIENLARSLSDGISTAGTAGIGLGGI